MKCGIAQTRWQGPAPSANKGPCGHLKVPQMIGLGMSEQREQAIRERAYALWEQDGRPEGRSLAHWSRAEAEIAVATLDKD